MMESVLLLWSKKIKILGGKAGVSRSHRKFQNTQTFQGQEKPLC